MSRGLEIRLRKLEARVPPANDYRHWSLEALKAEYRRLISEATKGRPNAEQHEPNGATPSPNLTRTRERLQEP